MPPTDKPGPGEFEIIERWFTRSVGDPSVRVGIGDDAAVVEAAGPIAVAVDMLVAGRHFPADAPPLSIGHRALAVNLSDLAAMGARPRYATLAISLPEADPVWLEAFARGFFALAERFDVTLIGGDTTRGPLTVTVGIIGDAAAAPLLRSGGSPGDLVFVSGTLGDAAGGLAIVGGGVAGGDAAGASRSAASRALVARFEYPEPRVALGCALVGIASAAIDVSDGLVADLGHICARSGTGAVIDLDALPQSEALLSTFPAEQAERFALAGGDDYELCFTAAPAARAQVLAAAAACGTRVTEIGVLRPEQGVVGRRGEREQALGLEAGGYTHF